MAKMVLNLKSQTNAIDYTKKNFVHAESIEELKELLAKRGEDGWTIGLNVIADYLRNAEAMLEPGVVRGGVYEVGKGVLVDVSQALNQGAVNNLHLPGRQVVESVNRVADYFPGLALWIILRVR